MNWCWMRKSLFSIKAFKSSCASSGNDSKKGSGKVVKSKDQCQQLHCLQRIASMSPCRGQRLCEVCCGKGPIEIHFPFDIGSIRSYMSVLLDIVIHHFGGPRMFFARCLIPALPVSLNVEISTIEVVGLVA